MSAAFNGRRFLCFLFNERENFSVQRLALAQAQGIGDDMAFPDGRAVGGRCIHEDDGVDDPGVIRVIGSRHVCAIAMMKGAVSRPQRQRHSRKPSHFRTYPEQAFRIDQILLGRTGSLKGAWDESHAASLDRHIAKRNPDRKGIGRIPMRPIRSVLVEFRRGAVMGLFDQSLVVPES